MESDDEESQFNSCDCLKKNFKYLRVLGRGGFATIYLAKSKKEPQLKYAIKYSNIIATTFHENVILSKLGKGSEHGHIISIYDEYQNHKEGKSIIVMEKARKSLADIIKKEGSIDKMLLMQIFMDILMALEFASQKSITHCDLKPENVLMFEVKDRGDKSLIVQDRYVVDREKVFKLTDWGSGIVGKSVMTSKRIKNNLCCTPIYAAPEVILLNFDEKAENNKIDLKKADVFSLGVCLLRCCGVVEDRFQMFSETAEDKHLKRYVDKAFDEYHITQKYGNIFSKILSKMLSFDPEERPNYQEIYDFLEERFVFLACGDWIELKDVFIDVKNNLRSLCPRCETVIEDNRIRSVLTEKLAQNYETCANCKKYFFKKFIHRQNCEHEFCIDCLQKLRKCPKTKCNSNISKEDKVPCASCQQYVRIKKLRKTQCCEMYFCHSCLKSPSNKECPGCKMALQLCDFEGYWEPKRNFIKLECCKYKACKRCMTEYLESTNSKTIECPNPKCEKALSKEIIMKIRRSPELNGNNEKREEVKNEEETKDMVMTYTMNGCKHEFTYQKIESELRYRVKVFPNINFVLRCIDKKCADMISLKEIKTVVSEDFFNKLRMIKDPKFKPKEKKNEPQKTGVIYQTKNIDCEKCKTSFTRSSNEVVLLMCQHLICRNCIFLDIKNGIDDLDVKCPLCKTKINYFLAEKILTKEPGKNLLKETVEKIQDKFIKSYRFDCKACKQISFLNYQQWYNKPYLECSFCKAKVHDPKVPQAKIIKLKKKCPNCGKIVKKQRFNYMICYSQICQGQTKFCMECSKILPLRGQYLGPKNPCWDCDPNSRPERR